MPLPESHPTNQSTLESKLDRCNGTGHVLDVCAWPLLAGVHSRMGRRHMLVHLVHTVLCLGGVVAFGTYVCTHIHGYLGRPALPYWTLHTLEGDAYIQWLCVL